ncbi:VWD domain-containing protein [Deinococcus cellulosilyticus]|nr:VWD domain-containing protein [Deinococcus cellulosilyticus]
MNLHSAELNYTFQCPDQPQLVTDSINIKITNGDPISVPVVIECLPDQLILVNPPKPLQAKVDQSDSTSFTIKFDHPQLDPEQVVWTLVKDALPSFATFDIRPSTGILRGQDTSTIGITMKCFVPGEGTVKLTINSNSGLVRGVQVPVAVKCAPGSGPKFSFKTQTPPTVTETRLQCLLVTRVDHKGEIRVALDQKEDWIIESYQVYVDGVLIGENTTGESISAGPYGPGQHPIEAVLKAHPVPTASLISKQSITEPMTFTDTSTLDVPPPTITSSPQECRPAPGEGSMPGEGSSYGDPHLLTYDNVEYSFQAVGEFILSKSTLPGDTFEVQTRYLPLPGNNAISANAAVAMRVGTDRVGVYAPPVYGQPPIFKVNGETVTADELGLYHVLPDGGVLSYDSGKLLTTIHWKNGYQDYQVKIHFYDRIVGRVTVTAPGQKRQYLMGLLGNFDTNPENDFQLRDGTVLSNPPAPKDLYARFGESWRITPQESLFDYNAGESTQTFTNRAFPVTHVGLIDLTPEDRQWAEQVCKDYGVVSQYILVKCTLDVALTKDPNWAQFSVGADPFVPQITLSPARVRMLTGDTLELFAGVSSMLKIDNNVDWSATNGTLTSTLDRHTMRYTAPGVPGEYTVTATLRSDPSVWTTVKIEVMPKAVTTVGALQLKLKWLDFPRDYDAHLWAPSSAPYHLYYGRPGSSDLQSGPHMVLDTDDIDGHGPETVTVVPTGTGKYEYWVNDYTNAFGIYGTEVEVRDDKGVVMTIPLLDSNSVNVQPNVVSAPGHWWHVLDIDAATGKITVVNQRGGLAEPYQDTDGTCNTPPVSVFHPEKTIWEPCKDYEVPGEIVIF